MKKFLKSFLVMFGACLLVFASVIGFSACGKKKTQSLCTVTIKDLSGNTIATKTLNGNSTYTFSFAGFSASEGVDLTKYMTKSTYDSATKYYAKNSDTSKNVLSGKTVAIKVFEDENGTKEAPTSVKITKDVTYWIKTGKVLEVPVYYEGHVNETDYLIGKAYPVEGYSYSFTNIDSVAKDYLWNVVKSVNDSSIEKEDIEGSEGYQFKENNVIVKQDKYIVEYVGYNQNDSNNSKQYKKTDNLYVTTKEQAITTRNESNTTGNTFVGWTTVENDTKRYNNASELSGKTIESFIAENNDISLTEVQKGVKKISIYSCYNPINIGYSFKIKTESLTDVNKEENNYYIKEIEEKQDENFKITRSTSDKTSGAEITFTTAELTSLLVNVQYKLNGTRYGLLSVFDIEKIFVGNLQLSFDSSTSTYKFNNANTSASAPKFDEFDRTEIVIELKRKEFTIDLSAGDFALPGKEGATGYEKTLDEINCQFFNANNQEITSIAVKFGATITFENVTSDNNGKHTAEVKVNGNVVAKAVITDNAKYTYSDPTWTKNGTGSITTTSGANNLGTFVVCGNEEINNSICCTFVRTVKKYTVTWYDGNGGVITLESEADEFEYGTTPTYKGTPAQLIKNSTVAYDYTFNGKWSKTNGGSEAPIENITGDVSYYALFNEVERKYTLVFNAGNYYVYDNRTEVPAKISGESGATKSLTGNTYYKDKATGEINVVSGIPTVDNGKDNNYFFTFNCWKQEGNTEEFITSISLDKIVTEDNKPTTKNASGEYEINLAATYTKADRYYYVDLFLNDVHYEKATVLNGLLNASGFVLNKNYYYTKVSDEYIQNTADYNQAGEYYVKNFIPVNNCYIEAKIGGYIVTDSATSKESFKSGVTYYYVESNAIKEVGSSESYDGAKTYYCKNDNLKGYLQATEENGLLYSDKFVYDSKYYYKYDVNSGSLSAVAENDNFDSSNTYFISLGLELTIQDHSGATKNCKDLIKFYELKLNESAGITEAKLADYDENKTLFVKGIVYDVKELKYGNTATDLVSAATATTKFGPAKNYVNDEKNYIHNGWFCEGATTIYTETGSVSLNWGSIFADKDITEIYPSFLALGRGEVIVSIKVLYEDLDGKYTDDGYDVSNALATDTHAKTTEVTIKDIGALALEGNWYIINVSNIITNNLKTGVTIDPNTPFSIDAGFEICQDAKIEAEFNSTLVLIDKTKKTVTVTAKRKNVDVEVQVDKDTNGYNGVIEEGCYDSSEAVKNSSEVETGTKYTFYNVKYGTWAYFDGEKIYLIKNPLTKTTDVFKKADKVYYKLSSGTTYQKLEDEEPLVVFEKKYKVTTDAEKSASKTYYTELDGVYTEFTDESFVAETTYYEFDKYEKTTDTSKSAAKTYYKQTGVNTYEVYGGALPATSTVYYEFSFDATKALRTITAEKNDNTVSTMYKFSKWANNGADVADKTVMELTDWSNGYKLIKAVFESQAQKYEIVVFNNKTADDSTYEMWAIGGTDPDSFSELKSLNTGGELKHKLCSYTVPDGNINVSVTLTNILGGSQVNDITENKAKTYKDLTYYIVVEDASGNISTVKKVEAGATIGTIRKEYICADEFATFDEVKHIYIIPQYTVEDKQYTVKFDININGAPTNDSRANVILPSGSSTATNNFQYAYDSETVGGYIYVTNIPSRDGYTFMGWSSEKDESKNIKVGYTQDNGTYKPYTKLITNNLVIAMQRNLCGTSNTIIELTGKIDFGSGYEGVVTGEGTTYQVCLDKNRLIALCDSAFAGGSKNVTLYAVWMPNVYRISYEKDINGVYDKSEVVTALVIYGHEDEYFNNEKIVNSPYQRIGYSVDTEKAEYYYAYKNSNGDILSETEYNALADKSEYTKFSISVKEHSELDETNKAKYASEGNKTIDKILGGYYAYERNCVVISASDYNALGADDKVGYEKRIISVNEYEEMSNENKAIYTKMYGVYKINKGTCYGEAYRKITDKGNSEDSVGDAYTVKVYVQWKENKYKIAYDLQDKKALTPLGSTAETKVSGELAKADSTITKADASIAYDSGTITIIKAERVGYTFNNWILNNNTNFSLTELTEIKLSALFTDSTYAYNQLVTIFGANDSTITLKAVWTPIKYTVTIINNDVNDDKGSTTVADNPSNDLIIDNNNDTFTIDFDSKININPTRQGYKLGKSESENKTSIINVYVYDEGYTGDYIDKNRIGYFESSDNIILDDSVGLTNDSTHLVFYENWTPNKYKIKLYPNAVSGSTIINLKSDLANGYKVVYKECMGSEVKSGKLQVFSRTEILNSDPVEYEYMLVETKNVVDETVYYVVEYIEKEVEFDCTETDIENAFSRIGYVLKWTKSGSEIIKFGYTQGTVSKNLTIVNNGEVTIDAKWEAKSFDVNFVMQDKSDNEGTTYAKLDKTLTYTFDTTTSLVDKNEEYISSYKPTRTGYKFLGWSTDKNGLGENNENKVTTTTQISAIDDAAQKATIYAIWEALTYTINFKDPQGSDLIINGSASYVATFDTAVDLGEANVTGYNYKSWKDTAGQQHTTTTDNNYIEVEKIYFDSGYSDYFFKNENGDYEAYTETEYPTDGTKIYKNAKNLCAEPEDNGSSKVTLTAQLEEKIYRIQIVSDKKSITDVNENAKYFFVRYNDFRIFENLNDLNAYITESKKGDSANLSQFNDKWFTINNDAKIFEGTGVTGKTICAVYLYKNASDATGENEENTRKGSFITTTDSGITEIKAFSADNKFNCNSFSTSTYKTNSDQTEVFDNGYDGANTSYISFVLGVKWDNKFFSIELKSNDATEGTTTKATKLDTEGGQIYKPSDGESGNPSSYFLITTNDSKKQQWTVENNKTIALPIMSRKGYKNTGWILLFYNATGDKYDDTFKYTSNSGKEVDAKIVISCKLQSNTKSYSAKIINENTVLETIFSDASSISLSSLAPYLAKSLTKQNVVFKAVWEANNVQISLELRDSQSEGAYKCGSTVVDNKDNFKTAFVGTFDETLTIYDATNSKYKDEYIPTRTGYTFLGWSTDATGFGEGDANKVKSIDLKDATVNEDATTKADTTTATYYAIWKANTYENIVVVDYGYLNYIDDNNGRKWYKDSNNNPIAVSKTKGQERITITMTFDSDKVEIDDSTFKDLYLKSFYTIKFAGLTTGMARGFISDANKELISSATYNGLSETEKLAFKNKIITKADYDALTTDKAKYTQVTKDSYEAYEQTYSMNGSGDVSITVADSKLKLQNGNWTQATKGTIYYARWDNKAVKVNYAFIKETYDGETKTLVKGERCTNDEIIQVYQDQGEDLFTSVLLNKINSSASTNGVEYSQSPGGAKGDTCTVVNVVESGTKTYYQVVPHTITVADADITSLTAYFCYTDIEGYSDTATRTKDEAGYYYMGLYKQIVETSDETQVPEIVRVINPKDGKLESDQSLDDVTSLTAKFVKIRFSSQKNFDYSSSTPLRAELIRDDQTENGGNFALTYTDKNTLHSIFRTENSENIKSLNTLRFYKDNYLGNGRYAKLSYSYNAKTGELGQSSKLSSSVKNLVCAISKLNSSYENVYDIAVAYTKNFSSTSEVFEILWELL